MSSTASTGPSPSHPPPSHAEASAYLTALLNRTLHVHIADGREFVGQMKCTDREMNVVLAMAQEVRRVGRKKERKETGGEEGAEKEGGEEGEEKVFKRFVGLVVVPGKEIVRVEIEP